MNSFEKTCPRTVKALIGVYTEEHSQASDVLCLYLCADLYVVDLQHGEELVEAGTQHGDGRGLDHQAAAWRRASSMESPQQGVISPVGGLAH